MTKLFLSFVKLYVNKPKEATLLYWLVPTLYLLWPLDFIPDVVPVLGYVDDLMLYGAAWHVFSKIRKLAQRFNKDLGGSGRARQEQQHTEPPKEAQPKNPYEVLELEPGASADQIKKAYRRLLGMYHPDKMEHLGPDFSHLAKTKTQEIIAAYEQLKS